MPQEPPQKHQSMESSEYSERSSKRVRLGYYLEPEIASFSSSQFEGRHHSLYTHSLEEAQSPSPLIPTCTTQHQLTVDYQSAQSTVWNHQIATNSRGDSNPSPSALSAGTAIPSQYNNGLSTIDIPGQVCFGMVSVPPLVANSKDTPYKV